MADIFLSCERTDRHRVAPIAALLEACGWSVGWDQGADAGEVRDHALERELSAARCVVAAWSADSVESDAVWSDASHALARGILISVSIDFSRPPPELEGAPAIALAGWTGDASSPRAQELISTIEAAIGASDGIAANGATIDEPPQRPATQLATPPSAARRTAVSADAPAFIQRATSASRDPDAVEIETDFRVEEQPTAPPAWAAADAEDQADVSLPPVLVRGLVPRPQATEGPRARVGSGVFAVALCAGLAIIAGVAALRITSGPDGPEPGAEAPVVTPVPEAPRKVVAAPTRAEPALPVPAPAEVKPTPVALTKPPASEPPPAAASPKSIEVEDLLADVTPRVEELLAGARRLIRTGDIRGAREMLEAPETAHSGLLTFLLAETYDPNVLPATLRRGMADPERARALYRKASELGDNRAQGRLNALKS
jgi:hypothetical protein